MSQRSDSIGALGRDHVLFFFFRSDCPYCHAFAPTLEAFQARQGIRVVAISVDGGAMPGFPDARRDNGNVREQNTLIESFPSNMVANSFNFAKSTFFELENPAEKNAPQVKFG